MLTSKTVANILVFNFVSYLCDCKDNIFCRIKGYVKCEITLNAKHFVPLFETTHAFLAKPIEALQDTLVRLLLLELGLREELVGIADDLFLHCLRRIVLQGQGKVLTLNGIGCQARTRVALGYTSMTGKSIGTKYFATNQAVADVMFRTKALDARCIGTQDANVVKHCRLVEKLAVESQLWMCITYPHTEVGHLTAVGEQNLFQFGLTGVVSMDEFLWIHGISIFLPRFT